MKLTLFYNSPAEANENFIVLGGGHEKSKVDIPKTSKTLPLLLARLAYVFEIYDDELKDSDEFEDFVEVVLKSVRVKKEIKNHNTTLEEVAGVLYLIDLADEIEVIVGEAEDEEFENLISFLNMFKSKVRINRDAKFGFYGI